MHLFLLYATADLFFISFKQKFYVCSHSHIELQINERKLVSSRDLSFKKKKKINGDLFLFLHYRCERDARSHLNSQHSIFEHINFANYNVSLSHSYQMVSFICACVCLCLNEFRQINFCYIHTQHGISLWKNKSLYTTNIYTCCARSEVFPLRLRCVYGERRKKKHAYSKPSLLLYLYICIYKWNLHSMSNAAHITPPPQPTPQLKYETSTFSGWLFHFFFILIFDK